MQKHSLCKLQSDTIICWEGPEMQVERKAYFTYTVCIYIIFGRGGKHPRFCSKVTWDIHMVDAPSKQRKET